MTERPTLIDVERERSRRSLHYFITKAWAQVEPGRPFVDNWHIGCIAEHLEAATNLEIRNLLVNFPPRLMKSLQCGVFWPAWVWGPFADPGSRWLYGSYEEALAIRDALKMRRLVMSPWFQARWPLAMAADENNKSRFLNEHNGFRQSSGIGGLNTGEGGDYQVADDPHKVREVESEPIRQGVIDWWKETMPTRFADPDTVRRVIVMQRIHEQDLSGYVIAEEGGYHHLCLPMRWEPPVYVEGYSPTDRRARGEVLSEEWPLEGRKPSVPQPHDHCKIASDPRKVEGELLFPARFSDETVTRLEKSMGAYGAAGQFQQRPVPRGGAKFREDWFRQLPAPAEFDKLYPRLRIVQAWDRNYSENDRSDWTVAVTVGLDQAGNVYLIDVFREHVAEEKGLQVVADQIARVKPHFVGLPLDAFRQPEGRDFVRLLFGALYGRHACAIAGVPVRGDKEERATLPANRAAWGMVFADKTAPWWHAFIAELLSFPKGAHDDQVDAFSLAVQLAIEPPRTTGSEQRSRGRPVAMG